MSNSKSLIHFSSNPPFQGIVVLYQRADQLAYNTANKTNSARAQLELDLDLL
jgi:hypothetical protein